MTRATAPRGKRVTRDDVARLAGVSGGAVSAVLNGARGNIQISTATRERIEAAARELGYRANPAAQSLRRQGARTLGIIVPGPQQHSYVQSVPIELSYHVRRAAGRHGYETIELAEGRRDVGSAGAARLLSNTPLAGLIIVSTEHGLPDLAADLAADPMPVVQVLRPRSDIRSSTVIVDPLPGFREAVEHLADLGHRQIGFIGAQPRDSVDRNRLEAFRAAMAASGMDANPQHILLDSYTVESGSTAVDALLDRPNPPTALITGADLVAFGVLKGCYRRRLRVPDQLSIVSYDDILADLVSPSLTTITQPLEELAEQAVAAALAALEATDTRPSGSPSERPPQPVDVALPSRLHVRESTGPAPTSR